MIRMLFAALAVGAGTLAFATPAAADPCGGGMANVEYALEIATGAEAPINVAENCVRCKCEACYPSACQCDVYCFCNKQPWTTGGELAECLRQFNDMWCPGEPNPLG